MAYASLSHAIDLYGDTYVLTSVDRDADGQPDTAALTAAFEQASSEIDSYLAARYPVPLFPVPALLVRFAVDIAIYQCSADAATGTDQKRKRYEDAIRWLEKVAKGDLTIGAEEPQDAGAPVMQASNRLFSRRSLRGLL